MEDVIDLIRESGIKTASYMDLPSEDDLVLIEEEILLPIPKDLRLFLLEVSDVICGSLEPVTVADPGAHTHLSEVTSLAWSLGMPRELMAICQDRENFYCITQDGEIQYWENGQISSETWKDIWDWAQKIWLS